MIVIIAGSRSITSYALVKARIERFALPITCVVSGAAAGVDSLGERWAAENGVQIKRFPANWQKHGRRAGPLRNEEMAKFVVEQSPKYGGCALIALWNGRSTGTRDMINRAEVHGIETFIDIHHED